MTRARSRDTSGVPPLDTAALAPHVAPGTDAEAVARYCALPGAGREALDLADAEREVAFLDVETTGFDPSRDAVIEIAVLVARGPEVIARYSTLVDPGVPIPREATQLTGIDAAAVAGAPHVGEAVCEALDVVGGRDIVAHNACFDEAFVSRAAAAVGRRVAGRWLDSLELARIALPRMKSHRLADLAGALGMAPATHRAADDVEAMFGVWRASLAGLADLPPELLAALVGLAPHVDWPLRDVLRLAATKGRGRALDLKRIRTESVRGHHAPGLPDADERELTCPDEAEVAAEFAADGAVGRMYEAFEPREEQTRMARAVLAAFAAKRHLAVEAGTGVGKSVAYLVPAARFAMDNHLGVGVATKTNSLMDQLVYGELPRLSEALGGRLRYLALKGYEHYPCLRKIERLAGAADEGTDAAAVANLAALLAWIAQSSWGDLDAVNVHWGPMRQRVACSVEDCTRKRCRYFPNLCYLHGVRRRAASAHVVVTNHALLFRDAAAAGGILPPLRYWIVDEAHSAESEARKQLSVSADHRALLSLLGALHTEGRGGAVDALRLKARAHAMAQGHEELAARVDRVTAGLRGDIATATTVAESFFDFMKDLPAEETEYDTVELHVTPLVRDSTEWSVAAGVGHSLARRLEAALAGGRDLLTALEEAGEELAEPCADLAGLLSRLSEQVAGLEVVLDGSNDAYVYSVQVSRRRDDPRDSVSACMLDVGGALLERFYPEVHSAVFTSATIAAGDDFKHLARTIGLDRLPQGSWESLRLESSYDFDRQMAVFVPNDLPEPSGRGHLAPLADLLAGLHTAMGGSVLTLFTSRREMERVFDLVAARLEGTGLRLLVQGRGVSVKRVRDEFLSDEHVSLFATKSFWEGFDAKGDTLRCVVVARLPFGRLRDPLYEERRARDARAWDDYYLPEAILELKQAAGRLVRSSTDEGCVVIADGRLSSGRGYAARFLDALPVSDIEVVSSEEVVEQVRERFGRRS